MPALTLILALGAFAGSISAGQAPKPLTACTLFTAAEIRRVTATKPSPVDSMKPEEHPTPGGGSECDIAGFGIQLDAVPVARFEANRQAYSTRAKYERVPDVADEAYYYDEGAASSVRTLGIYARTATHVFVISNIVAMNEKPEALRPQLIALGKAAAVKLR
jgi:hypothetical protein